jgi:hypothetical protein
MLRLERELADKAKKGKPASSDDDDELRQMEEQLANLGSMNLKEKNNFFSLNLLILLI